ncbi:uncharacterized protein LOC124164581 isoform X3 [Ischnura elegans]|uniref:uncharacterized protein LOC124164581 isoform X3 n=1 Tax=Ischnura elegans TaxID=197161 RepID=UPI001ED899AE|nr:uncharacterized protein LOC124164581 isoform X3 [Ischnura elegans]XP_046397940.1 uncharacterized protein LOC124164581 isoform X3 [Ischnura elegans]
MGRRAMVFFAPCNRRSCSQQFFIRPEESFLAAMSSSVRGGVSPAPDWMRASMPTQCTVALTPSFHPRGPGGGAGGGGAVCSDTNWSKGRRSCSGDASVPVRKMVRFRCHTCAEKLPTLNSLRTHLKSHSRPAPLTLPAALRCDQHLMPSATVVTSKYGRRRAVVSALVAIKPTRR